MPSAYEVACVKAVKTAFKQHWTFTGGLPLTFAPDAYIQGQIAHELSKRGLYVTMESKVYEALTEAGAEMRGRYMKRVGGRLDLVTWWKNGTPRHLIEVKKLRHKEAIAADVKRLRAMLKRGGSTRQGLIVLYADARKPDTVTRRIEYAASAANAKLVVRSGIETFETFWNENATWHYEAACLRVEA